MRAFLIFCGIGLATGMVVVGQSCSRLNGGTFVVENGRQPSSNSSRGCVPGAGVSGSPRSVDQVITLINSLPRPVTLPCFIESLDSPLRVFASQSSASVQPSSGPENPRFFIFSLPLIMTVTTDGSGASRMEMSVLKGGNAVSTKSEILFPVVDVMSASDPYARVFAGPGTSCASCHSNEAPDPTISIAAAFVSTALRPLAASEVDLNFMRVQFSSCDPILTPDRCLLLRALFENRSVIRTDFPAGMQVP